MWMLCDICTLMKTYENLGCKKSFNIVCQMSFSQYAGKLTHSNVERSPGFLCTDMFGRPEKIQFIYLHKHSDLSL